MSQFGMMLRAGRNLKGMSLSQLAREADTFKGYISGIENGALNPPSQKMTARLCKILDLDFQGMLAIGWIEKRPDKLKLESIRNSLNLFNKSNKTAPDDKI